MIGLDTNVLVRYLTQDDERQGKLAAQVIEKTLSRECPGFINSIVLVELFWTLKRLYKVEKEALFQILEELLLADSLRFEHREEAWKALRLSSTQGVDFPDALIGEINKQRSCVETLTFDKRAATIGSFSKLS